MLLFPHESGIAAAVTTAGGIFPGAEFGAGLVILELEPLSCAQLLAQPVLLVISSVALLGCFRCFFPYDITTLTTLNDPCLNDL